MEKVPCTVTGDLDHPSIGEKGGLHAILAPLLNCKLRQRRQPLKGVADEAWVVKRQKALESCRRPL
jgi:hypothetical protein